MLVGGIATGGVGLVVGGLVGGGGGTAIAGLTGNRDIDIPAESIVRFTLADDLVVQTAQ
jgi:outer membrane lipoprotein SlyB